MKSNSNYDELAKGDDDLSIFGTVVLMTIFTFISLYYDIKGCFTD